jgi:ribosomal protein L37AE/L43A
MDYKCPSCGSDNIQKISLTVMKGTKSSALGSSQSFLAEAHSPPSERRTFWWCIGLFFFAPGAVTTGNGFFIVVALSCIAGLGHAIYYNNKVYPTEVREWNSRWICQRCASVFKI